MKQSVTEMQENILKKMEKHKRNAQSQKTPTLEEQLKERAAYDKLSPAEKRAKMDWRDWSDAVIQKLSGEYRAGTKQYITKIVQFTHRNRFEEFHRSGKSMREIAEIVMAEMPDRYDL